MPLPLQDAASPSAQALPRVADTPSCSILLKNPSLEHAAPPSGVRPERACPHLCTPAARPPPPLPCPNAPAFLETPVTLPYSLTVPIQLGVLTRFLLISPLLPATSSPGLFRDTPEKVSFPRSSGHSHPARSGHPCPLLGAQSPQDPEVSAACICSLWVPLPTIHVPLAVPLALQTCHSPATQRLAPSPSGGPLPSTGPPSWVLHNNGGHDSFQGLLLPCPRARIQAQVGQTPAQDPPLTPSGHPEM